MAYSADVLIVGAGIGGLTAAALLQERGFSTLTLEKNSYPGGSCASFSHQGYTFDAGASVFYGFAGDEKSGTLNLHTRIFNRLGITLPTIADPVQIHYHLPDGLEVPVYYEKERFLATLIDRFPSEEVGIRAFYQELEAVYEILSALPAGSLEDVTHILQVGMKHPGKVMALAVKTFKSMGKTARKYISDDELLRFIDMESYSWAVQDAVSTPLVNAGICLADRHHGGINYPAGGSGAIPAALCEGIRKFGGEVAFGCDAEEILLQNGRAAGVRLRNGEVFTAKAVISNATVWDTFNRLLKDPRYDISEERFLRAPSWFQLYLGVDAGVIPDGFHVHHILVDEWDKYNEIGGTIYFSAPSMLDPSLAPEGKHVIHAFVTDEMDRWNGYARGESAYSRAKEGFGNSVIIRTEKILPGLSDALDVRLFATPLTNQRYLNRYKGSYGPLLYPGQNVLQKPQNCTVVKDLYAVGDSTFPGQGVIAVTYSGVSCASYVARVLGNPLEYL
ncbi:MAG: NAD(P)/FAD-dependent oxidoreductase [Chlorobium sp.]|nr:NAD(P)/FAD-dependent oxidoreductase [Chlorobium sp.]MCW8816051.1 NAD(P)/FAD-dependent oxidoreductase [Chlorobium sp.]MCW8820561.1 NAD(P)/FAD-dependent oxidoreductase [Ignavibacteriaceae bacterium]